MICTDLGIETRMTYRALLSEPTVVVPQLLASGTSDPSVGSSHPDNVNDNLPVKRPHEPDNARNEAVDHESGSKKRRRKRVKHEAS